MPTGGVYGYEKSTFRKEDFQDFEKCQFEGFSFRIPIGYDNILKVVYGDYMLLPPVERRNPWYGADYFDADIGYAVYLDDNISRA